MIPVLLLADVVWCTFGPLAWGNGAARNQHEADYWYEKAWVISMIAWPFAFPHGSVCCIITINGFEGIKLLVAAHLVSRFVFSQHRQLFMATAVQRIVFAIGGVLFVSRKDSGRDEGVSPLHHKVTWYDMVWLYTESVNSVWSVIGITLFISLYHLFMLLCRALALVDTFTRL